MVTVSHAKLSEKLVSIRRDLHRFPELGWHEKRTTEKISKALDELGIPYRRLPGLTGVIADIPGPEGVPVVALRADIDALPIHEETDLEFISSIEGNMHACGHDGHVSMLLGAAELLVSQSELPAPVRLLFQPAEELGAGALKMIEHDALKNVGMIFGGHIDRHFKPGVIAVTEGVVNASADKFIIDITGKGGHAARPHETVDAVIAGSLLVIALQTIVSREVNPAHPSVVTVGKFEAGTASNVIAGRCHMEGTIRTQDEEVRAHLHEALFRMAQSVGQLHGASIDCRIVESLPVLSNSPSAFEIARKAAVSIAGAERVEAMKTANMGGEDFSFYVLQVPGCYVRFGGQVEGCVFPAHSSKFVFDESCLLVGAKYYAEVAQAAGIALRAN